MKIISCAFTYQKFGNFPQENEDAYSRRYKNESANFSRFALADGATEGILSGYWARILVKEFRRYKILYKNCTDFYKDTYDSWDLWKNKYIERREKQNKPIQWFEEPGLLKGTFSTILGLAIYNKPNTKMWFAIALGDTCLFHIRENKLLKSFPIEQSKEFNNSPLLISSNPERNMDVCIKKTKGDWKNNDQFFLMTDALAAWFLREVEAGKTPWEELCRFNDTIEKKEEFFKWINELRLEKQIRNDDVTLLRIDLI